MIEIVIGYLGASLLLYAILGGADFGAGIIESLPAGKLREAQEKVVTRALGPVWEANHIWLILVVVILFNAFPPAFSAIMTTFHIPVTLMLVGIVLRGCSFTFRHYDAIEDGSRRVYSAIFVASSYLAPFFEGVIVGGLLLGRTGDPTSFRSAYVDPWANPFSASVGVFFCTLVTFLAAVFLTGETENPALKRLFTRRAAYANLLAIVAGLAVFVFAELEGLPVVRIFLEDAKSGGCVAVATLFLLPLWISVRRGNVMFSRLFVASIVALVVLGWMSLQYPYLIFGAPGAHPGMTFEEAAAPPAVLRILVGALLAATVLVGPLLALLLRTFKGSGPARH